jgi:hypothetical protein
VTETWDPFASTRTARQPIRPTHPDQSSPAAPYPGPQRPSTAVPDPASHPLAAATRQVVPTPAPGLHVPVPGWYPTAEGTHERYWDGVNWSAARLRSAPVITHPEPSPDDEHIELPDHPYRDLPAYAAVPPYKIAVGAFLDALAIRKAMPGERHLFSGTGWAWPVALWPAVWVSLLMLIDVLATLDGGRKSLDPAIALATHSALPTIVFWLGPVAWVALALVDTLWVRRRCPRVEQAAHGRRPRSSAPMGRHWSLVPPLQALVRATAARSSRGILACMVIAMLFPAVWFAPQSWITPDTATDQVVDTQQAKKPGKQNRQVRQRQSDRTGQVTNVVQPR